MFHVTRYIWVCLTIPCPTQKVWLGGMIRGYDSWVWLTDLDLVFPCILRVWFFTHTYPQNVSTVGNWTIRGALWSWHAVDSARAAVRVVCALWSGHRGAIGVPLQGAGAGHCLLSEWCVQFGATLVALRVLLQVLTQGDVWRCCCQIGVCLNHALERACWWADAGGRCCLRVLSSQPAGAAARGDASGCCKEGTYCTQLVLQGRQWRVLLHAAECSC